MLETKLGDFEEVILLMVGILGTESAYPFKIVQEFEAQTGRAISIGAVHATLDRLQNKGFVKSEMKGATTERGGRRKRLFTITALGKKVLKDSRDFKMALWDQYPALAR